MRHPTVPGRRLDQSRSCFARDRDPSFTRASILTGAPNKGRGRSAQPASELMVEGRSATSSSVPLGSGPGALLNQCRLHKTKKHTLIQLREINPFCTARLLDCQKLLDLQYLDRGTTQTSPSLKPSLVGSSARPKPSSVDVAERGVASIGVHTGRASTVLYDSKPIIHELMSSCPEFALFCQHK